MAAASRSVRARIRAELVARFPACFMPKGADKKPLAIGIHAAVIEAAPDLKVTHVRAAIRDYATGPKYWRNVVAGAARIGLDGQPVSLVTEEHAAHAAKVLAGIGWKQPAESEAA